MLDHNATCRLTRAKQAFATRRVPLSATYGLETDVGLSAGDVVLATVTQIGQHGHLELTSGRRAALKTGDEIIVACGARYAPDQFHALLPERTGPANLVASGGIAGIEVARHSGMREATQITIAGRLTQAGRPVNLMNYALPAIAPHPSLPIIAVVGTSMNAGKTATCAALVHSLAATGRRSAYVKATGTGSGGDLWKNLDAGAMIALDFVDAGYGTTYLAEPSDLTVRALSLAAHAARNGANIVVMEIADGVLQSETAYILKDELFRSHIQATVLAAGDSMGACGAISWLKAAGHNLIAVTGAFTQSPLAIAEVQAVTGQQPLTLSAIRNGALSPVIATVIASQGSDFGFAA